VTQCVKPHPGQTGALRGRHEHAPGESSGVRRSALAAGKTNASSGASGGRSSRSVAASPVGSATRSLPCRDFGAPTTPLTIARLTCSRGAGTSK
jgi:hypothetical protein